MDRSRFTDSAPGSLEPISTSGSEDWAFVPASLPKNLTLTEKSWPLLVKAREELGRLDGIGRHMQDYELLLQPLQKREALRSSSLEGTYATPEQLFLFEIEPKEPKSTTDPVNAWKEVSNYSKALQLGQNMLSDFPISLRLIREMHRELLSGVRGHQRDPGNFRRAQVHIGSDRRFIPPPPGDAMMKCLFELEKHIHEEVAVDPLVNCFLVHYQFETIHPFLDGNGRVGRLLLSLMIFEQLKLTRPWLYLSAFFDRYKDEYISNLFRVSTMGDWDGWISFCLKGTIAQSKDSVNRCDRLLTLQNDFNQRVHARGGNIRLIDIVRRLFIAPMISIPSVAKTYGVSSQTARNDIHVLLDEGILVDSTLSRRPIVFCSPDILSIAYAEEIET